MASNVSHSRIGTHNKPFRNKIPDWPYSPKAFEQSIDSLHPRFRRKHYLVDAVKGGPTTLDQDHTTPYMILQRRKGACVIPTLPKMLRPIHRIFDSFLLQPLCNGFLFANMISNKTYRSPYFSKRQSKKKKEKDAHIE